MREGHELPAGFPERLGRYEILLPIARGGMGVVYLARARGAGGFEREAALKLLPQHLSHGERHALELIEEAKLAVRIRHPNVVQILDVDEGPLGVFMAMEYVEGCSLSGLLAAAKAGGARLPPEVGLRILLDALAGLHAAHELAGEDGRPLGLVHRDFSPQNILIGADGTSKLADFGIAKASSRSGHTTTGTIKGKVAYMAPEQLTGAPLDRRCDVWAAGVVAWEIMAGRHLREASDEIVMMYQIAHVPAPRLGASGVDMPVELDLAIARALMIDPSARCSTAAAFARTLEAAGVEIASPEEVAAYVRRFLGPELAQRRARIAEILELRREGARVASLSAPPVSASAAPDAQLTPPADDARTTREPQSKRHGGPRALRLGAAIAASMLIALGAWTAFGRMSVTPPLASAEAESRATETLVPSSLPVVVSAQSNLDTATPDSPSPDSQPAPVAAASAGRSASPAPAAPRSTTTAPATVASPKAGSKRGSRPPPPRGQPLRADTLMRLRGVAALGFCVVLGSLGATRPARADEASAAETFRAGAAAYARGEYRAAALAFEAAFHEQPHAAALYNAGRSWAAAGAQSRAADAYAAALQASGLDSAQEADSRARLEELEAALGTVQVTAPAGALVSLEHVERAPAPVLVHVTPGSTRRRALSRVDRPSPGRCMSARASASRWPSTHRQSLLTLVLPRAPPRPAPICRAPIATIAGPSGGAPSVSRLSRAELLSFSASAPSTPATTSTPRITPIRPRTIAPRRCARGPTSPGLPRGCSARPRWCSSRRRSAPDLR